MKELKFRFWNKAKNRYADTFILAVVLHNGSLELGDHITIEQFTGLYDKNGKEIYEGDILKRNIKTPWNEVANVYIGEVVFCSGEFLAKENLELESIKNFLYHSYEIIGNIHENPELLKGVD